MKFNPFKIALPAFGLQLNGTAVKMMQLERSGPAVRVRSFANANLPKNVVASDTILDENTLARFIEQCLQQPAYGRINTNRVIVSLPETKSFVRVIHLPVMSEQELENAVPFEAEAYIPLPIDQVYFDWQVLGTKDGRMAVLIIASPKETVDKYIHTLEKAHLNIVAIEVESQSLERALIAPGSTETSLIVDLDSFKTNLIMVEQGNLQFSSSIPIAGNSFTERIAQTLGVSSEQAEKIKRQIGIDNTPEYPNIKTALLPLLTNLSEEIKNILKFHYDHSQEKVGKIVLSGGMAKMKNLSEYLQAEIKEGDDVKIEVANPWQNIPHLAEPPLPAFDSLGLTAAIGLVMRTLM